jgi:hypothetical protein
LDVGGAFIESLGEGKPTRFQVSASLLRSAAQLIVNTGLGELGNFYWLPELTVLAAWAWVANEQGMRRAGVVLSVLACLTKC